MSLRDVQRLLEVAGWFYSQRGKLFHRMDALLQKRMTEPQNREDEADDKDRPEQEFTDTEWETDEEAELDNEGDFHVSNLTLLASKILKMMDYKYEFHWHSHLLVSIVPPAFTL